MGLPWKLVFGVFGLELPCDPRIPKTSNTLCWMSLAGPELSPCLVVSAAPPSSPPARRPMLHLHHDAWAAIGQYLDPVSVYQLSSTCRDLHSDVSKNAALWRALALKRWPMLAGETNADTVRDWHGLYKASHAACCQVGGRQPLWQDELLPPSSPSPLARFMRTPSAAVAAAGDCPAMDVQYTQKNEQYTQDCTPASFTHPQPSQQRLRQHQLAEQHVCRSSCQQQRAVLQVDGPGRHQQALCWLASSRAGQLCRALLSALVQ